MIASSLKLETEVLPLGIVKAKFTPFVVLDTATPAVEPELAEAVTLVVVRMSVAVGRLD